MRKKKLMLLFFFFSSRRRHTRFDCDWSSDVCSSDLFGVMGGNMQPQGHIQMIIRLVEYNQNPQACSDAPRWIINEDYSVSLEDRIPDSVKEELVRRGHRI